MWFIFLPFTLFLVLEVSTQPEQRSQPVVSEYQPCNEECKHFKLDSDDHFIRHGGILITDMLQCIIPSTEDGECRINISSILPRRPKEQNGTIFFLLDLRC